MTTVILFVFGTFLGSFLNVVATRWGHKDFISDHSACPHCNKRLAWYELVPLVSFVLQRGKCRGCGARISWQYPLVEILTGLIFATIFNFQFSIFNNLIILTVFSIYIVIAVYDFHHKIIPDPLVYTAILLSVVSAWLSAYSVVDWLAGPVIFLFFASVWFLSRGRAMGFGDAKLGLSVGLLLGMAQGLSALVLSFWIGAFVSLFLVWSKKFTIKSEIPFAPFIILGAWLALIFNLDILNATTLL